MSADSPERAERTRKFQLVNDAYYTLSDSNRRREYDAQRRMFGFTPSSGGGNSYTDPFEDFEEEIPTAGAGAGAGAGTGAAGGGFPSWAWSFFTGQGTKNNQNAEQARQQNDSRQFADVFEEMLREEGLHEAEEANNAKKGGTFWGVAGGVSGGVLGFIVANFPGLMAGAVAGNRLGAIRDARGKSVYEVFQELPQSDRAALLAQLAAKVFSHTVGA